MRTPTPDPDYDNLSYKSARSSPRTPRAPREYPANQKHPSFDDNSSDTGSYEDHGGRYTPRSSNASEYGRNIPRYQPMPNLIMGYGRGRVSPALSETSMGGHQAKRSPSTESFFGKNGANVSQTGSSSQLWYQKYKHSSFSAAQQTSQSGVFGEPLCGHHRLPGRRSRDLRGSRSGFRIWKSMHLVWGSSVWGSSVWGSRVWGSRVSIYGFRI